MNPTELMSYIGSPEPQYGARKYTGSVATGYDAKRVESPKWAAEQEIIENFIDAFPDGSQVLDIPVGTGRFVTAYERNNHLWIGVDLSNDMLAEANAKVTKPDLAKLLSGDVTRLDEFAPEKAVDLAIMCRLTRWVGLTGNEKSVEEARAVLAKNRTLALKQIQRVSRRLVIFTARIANHPYAYPLEAMEAALEPGWRIADNIICGEDDYRVFVLERV